jgi:hypothetical protein
LDITENWDVCGAVAENAPEHDVWSNMACVSENYMAVKDKALVYGR